MNYTKKEKEFIEKEFKNLCSPYKYVPAIIPAQKKIVVFGDIHGDYALTIDLFLKAKLINFIDDKIVWCGGSTYVVQVGDQIDRCRPNVILGLTCDNNNTTYNDEANDIKILELFNYLHLEALKVGGAVISLLGNHELMNVFGILDYVSPAGINQFNNYKSVDNLVRFKNGKDARAYAFRDGNQYGKMLGCTRLPAVIIGSNLFVHAGIIDKLIDEIKLTNVFDLEKINIKIRKWLIGIIAHNDVNYVQHIIKYSSNSMFWTRILGTIPANTSMNDKRCYKNVKNALKIFKIGSMIVGHTPQSFKSNEDINSTCDGAVWRVDNGSSAAFHPFDEQYMQTGIPTHSRRAQYLEIINDNQYFVCDGFNCKKEIYN